MTTIDPKELKRLQESDLILNLLHNGGVDDWEGYDFALEDYRNSKEKEEYITNLTPEILENLGEFLCEPAGPGAGFGWQDSAYEYLDKRLNKEFNKEEI